MKVLLKLLMYVLAVYLAAYLLSGVSVASNETLLLVALVLMLLRTVIRPILLILTLPFTILTFGLFVFVVNGIIVLMADALISGFEVQNLGWAIAFSLIVSLCLMVFEAVDKDTKKGKKK